MRRTLKKYPSPLTDLLSFAFQDTVPTGSVMLQEIKGSTASNSDDHIPNGADGSNLSKAIPDEIVKAKKSDLKDSNSSVIQEHVDNEEGMARRDDERRRLSCGSAFDEKASTKTKAELARGAETEKLHDSKKNSSFDKEAEGKEPDTGVLLEQVMGKDEEKKQDSDKEVAVPTTVTAETGQLSAEAKPSDIMNSGQIEVPEDVKMEGSCGEAREMSAPVKDLKSGNKNVKDSTKVEYVEPVDPPAELVANAALDVAGLDNDTTNGESPSLKGKTFAPVTSRSTLEMLERSLFRKNSQLDGSSSDFSSGMHSPSTGKNVLQDEASGVATFDSDVNAVKLPVLNEKRRSPVVSRNTLEMRERYLSRKNSQSDNTSSDFSSELHLPSTGKKVLQGAAFGVAKLGSDMDEFKPPALNEKHHSPVVSRKTLEMRERYLSRKNSSLEDASTKSLKEVPDSTTTVAALPVPKLEKDSMTDTKPPAPKDISSSPVVSRNTLEIRGRYISRKNSNADDTTAESLWHAPDETLSNAACGVAGLDNDTTTGESPRLVACRRGPSGRFLQMQEKYDSTDFRRTSTESLRRESVSDLQWQTQPGAVAVTTVDKFRDSISAYSVGDSDESQQLPRPSCVYESAWVARRKTELIPSAVCVEDPVYAHATAVPERCSSLKRHKYKMLCCFVVVLAGVGAALGILLPKGSSSSSSDAADQAYALPPTLQAVKERGVLRCGLSDKLGFSELDEETGERKGFEVDLCRALAAAVLGDSYLIETTTLPAGERFVSVANGSLDVVAQSATHTMERDVFERVAKAGVSFSIPYMYDGLGFGGVPPFGSCANDLNTKGDCADLKVCVEAGTTHINILEGLLPSSRISIQASDKDSYQGLIDGDCNAIAGEQFNLAQVTVRREGYTGPYEAGNNRFSKEPLAVVTRDGDPEWADFVNWVVQALFEAEVRNITMSSASDFGKTSYFGNEYQSMFINALAEVGNYGEIYDRHLQSIVPRGGMNLINTEKTASGLLYAHPFGKRSPGGAGPFAGGTLEQIVQRGNLRCGVMDRLGFAHVSPDTGEWSGIDVDYCRALSASVFGGVVDSIEFVEGIDTDELFVSLAEGDVDVVAGGLVNLERDVMDSTSGKGYSFTQPYFYGSPDFDNYTLNGPLALATRQDDDQWSDFVYWIVSFTFFAEEENITKENSNDLPEVNLFGPKYLRMLRDAILSVGNYGEMYERNVEPFIPRSGQNLLNTIPQGPQQFSLPWGR